MDDTVAAATSLAAAAAAADGAAAHPDESVSFTIPRKSGVAIYFPGYINPESPAAALSTLGGEPGLSAALSEQPTFLKLRLRPEDPYSHPLFGERAQQAGLLLRIARPKGQPEAAPSVTCVSRVAATYAFNGMADYQYLGHDPEQYSRHVSQQQQQQPALQLSKPNLPINAEPQRQPGPFLLLPPLFSKVDMPVAYGFKDTAAAAGAGEDAAANPRSKDEPTLINFYDGIPPPALALDPESLTQQQQQHLPRLQALLQQRPAWHIEALLSQLPGLSEEGLKPLLVALCYQFKTGPWKSLWISCGVDPRENSDTRRYQNIFFRQPAEWTRAVKAARQAGRPLKQPSLAAMCCFTALPVSYNTPLQLCDLQDEAIRQLVSSAPVTHTPSEAYGWFTYTSTQQMQQALSMAFAKVLPQALAQLKQQQQQPGATEDGDQMEVDGEQQQQQQQQDKEAAAAAAAKSTAQQQKEGNAVAPAAAAAAAAEAEGQDLVGMLGLDADEDLKQFLRDAAAAAEERQRLRAAAAAAAAAASGATGTAAAAAGADVGLSGSEWEATSGAETTEGEDDGLTSEGDWGTDADDVDEEGGDGLEAYNEDV